jgi:hypothetical protein
MNKAQVRETHVVTPAIHKRPTAFGENPEEFTPERDLWAAVIVRAISDAAEPVFKKVWANNKDKVTANHTKTSALAFLSAVHQEPYPQYSALWCLSIFHDSPETAQKMILQALRQVPDNTKRRAIPLNLALEVALAVRSKKTKKNY